MGSSAVTAALGGADQLPSGSALKAKYHPKCILFEQLLKNELRQEHQTFNFAINGSVASDQYMILSVMKQMHCLPKVVIYGITARDFTNNGLYCPANTPVFQFFDQCFGIAKQCLDVYANETNPLHGFMTEHLFFLRESKKLKALVVIGVNKLLSLTVNRYNKTLDSDKPIELKLPSATELAKKKYRCFPSRAQKAYYLLERKPIIAIDLKRYDLIYKPFHNFSYQQQLHYFDRMIALCKETGTGLVIVNMPTTRENKGIFGTENYKNYLLDTKTRIRQNGFTFIDMNNLEKFSSGFFYDSVHLNPVGAKIFITNLVAELCTKSYPFSTAKCKQNKIDEHISNFKSKLNEANSIYTSDEKELSHVPNMLASWWLTKAYFAEPKPPDIVILGSSQLGPLLGADAYVYDRAVDITGDHRSRVLEHDFHALLNKNWRVFIGALPKAMISDQLVIAKALFSKKYKPKLVAITFSPRDFIDNYIPSVTSTEAFAFFSKYSDSIGLRNDLAKASIGKYRVKQPYDYGSENKSSFFLGEPFERISPGEIVICADDDYSREDNTEEYKLRYKNPMSSQLAMQMNYLDSLLKYLAEQHIQVVAFNFPISAANRKLLPDKFWKYYYERIDEICRKNGAHFISADRVVLPFKENEFIDGVHLDVVGGHRWSKTVAVFIANKYGPKTYQQLLTREKYLQ